MAENIPLSGQIDNKLVAGNLGGCDVTTAIGGVSSEIGELPDGTSPARSRTSGQQRVGSCSLHARNYNTSALR